MLGGKISYTKRSTFCAALAAQNTRTGTKKEYILYLCGMWAGNKGEQKLGITEGHE